MSNISKSDNLSSFTTMLKSALGSRVDQNANDFIELMAADAVMEFPYAPSGGTRSLHGHAELANHLSTISGIMEVGEMTNLRIHQTIDPEVVILEFSCIGKAIKTGRPYHQDFISVITTKGEKIIRYVDYWNPLVALAAIGDADMPGNASGHNQPG